MQSSAVCVVSEMGQISNSIIFLSLFTLFYILFEEKIILKILLLAYLHLQFNKLYIFNYIYFFILKINLIFLKKNTISVKKERKIWI